MRDARYYRVGSFAMPGVTGWCGPLNFYCRDALENLQSQGVSPSSSQAMLLEHPQSQCGDCAPENLQSRGVSPLIFSGDDALENPQSYAASPSLSLAMLLSKTHNRKECPSQPFLAMLLLNTLNRKECRSQPFFWRRCFQKSSIARNAPLHLFQR